MQAYVQMNAEKIDTDRRCLLTDLSVNCDDSAVF